MNVPVQRVNLDNDHMNGSELKGPSANSMLSERLSVRHGPLSYDRKLFND